MTFILVIGLYILIIGFDYIPLIKKKDKKEMFVYSIFLILSFVLIFLIILDVHLPSPTNFIKYLLKPIKKI